MTRHTDPPSSASGDRYDRVRPFDASDIEPRASDRRLVQAHHSDGVLVEWYYDTPGPPLSIPRHVHDTYQLGIALDRGGEYDYRGSRVPVPVRQVILLHPDEPHAVRDTEPRTFARYLMMYLDPRVVERVVAELTSQPATLPFFPEVSPADAPLAQQFRALFARGADALERDERLLGFLATLITRHARGAASAARLAPARPQVERAREYLRAHYSSPVSLARLARIAGLSRYHLVREFRRAVGVPPHTFQRQLRIEHAKRRLADGVPAARAAVEAGFFDQSHLARHFRPLVGVTPGRYGPR